MSQTERLDAGNVEARTETGAAGAISYPHFSTTGAVSQGATRLEPAELARLRRLDADDLAAERIYYAGELAEFTELPADQQWALGGWRLLVTAIDQELQRRQPGQQSTAGAVRPTITRELIAEIKQRVDLAQLFLDEGVDLRKNGSGHVGKCLFHTEDTPSLHVYPDGHYHCFGCGVHGDAITFTQQTRGMDFIPALHFLAALGGVPIPRSQAPRVPVTLNVTDLGNAERLVQRHGRDLHYCYPLGCWFVWTGQRWREDKAGELVRRAKDTVRAIYAEAAATEDDATRRDLGAHARRSEGEQRLHAMIALAQSEPGIPVLPESLDADPWLLNCLNGTINLQTGELREHRRGDLITKLAPVSYDPQATSELWQRFLDEATGSDTDMQDFLCRAGGYSATGRTDEEVLFFLHGPAATGKTTKVEALKATLGDYARTADFEVFLRRRDAGGPRPEIARLAGARFVAGVEVDEGRQLAEGLIKILTGGDTVTARHLYAKDVEFRPSMKLWLAANHAPRVSDSDSAMWRRILRVPFVHVVPKEKRDPKVKAALCDPTISGPAIMAWLVRGALAWQKIGLGVPPAVVEATNTYRSEMDPLKDFFDTYCAFDKAAWTGSAALRNAYERWAREVGEHVLVAGKEWAERLRAKGCAPGRLNKVRGWFAVKLVDAEAVDVAFDSLANGGDSSDSR